MRTLTRVALSLAVSGAVAFSPASAAEGSIPQRCQLQAAKVMKSDRDRSRDTVQIRTLHVKAAALKKSYRIGDVAKVSVTVSRPAGEDPFGNGVPVSRPASVPASDIYVGVGVNLGDVFLPGFAVTDVQGKATVKIPIKSYAPPKKAQVSVYAYHTDLDTACFRLEENGYQEYKNMFSVKPR